jgi:rhodanese-related sulfurtransferase
MPVKRVPPDEAARLVQAGWKLIDVRSVPEFEQGHPSGAYNVPFMHRAASGMTPNSEFVKVMEARFGKDERLILGCGSGNRSSRAAQMLESHGFAELIDMRGGMRGETDPSGAVACEGWVARGLPLSRSAEAGHSYEELAAKPA